MNDQNLINKPVKVEQIIDLLRNTKVETGSLMCFGCGYEHHCGIHGCAIMNMAADRLANDQTHIAALQQEIKKLRSDRRWIPVTERLPEVWRNDETAELVNYMIYSPDFGVDIGNYHAKAKKWFCMALPCTVTHWMPLPEPPEVEE